MSETNLGRETARDEVNSARVGSVVTMETGVLSLEDIVTLIMGVGYIVLTATDPKDSVVMAVDLRKEKMEY